ncbi:multicopper oxidase LPR2-like isoform X2 [Phalaenopsis equestris]|uniref:multicopper oxidase LPR2-like isoform X2 n=1 Tax=Phalaenopsis equestris TaxID=78828 RepID=UPI0009E3B695|nr:multicopper oxidase LPR2-like isoform X2 [Phalaenopsis equestris]
MAKFLLLLLLLLFLLAWAISGSLAGGVGLVNVTRLEMFVDELPGMPRLQGYRIHNGLLEPGNLTIGMYKKTWKFHRDLPPTRVFAYGASRATATVPGPTIEALQGIPTHITWKNHLPSRHILPWDPTIPIPSAPSGVPTVVHLHGGVHPPASDGHSQSWFTSNFSSVGPAFSSPTFSYPNLQDPGNLWYHDHALGLTRVNMPAGLLGAYTIRSPALESPLRLPYGANFDRHLIIFDRSFLSDGSLFLNSTGNNPSIHPQWQPEYFGDALIVNGKAWPFLRVLRRRYRFRIINASNARFYRLSFSNSLAFLHLASDSIYLPRPVPSRKFLLAPSEIADVVVDFTDSPTDSVVLLNDAAYPFPSGEEPDNFSGKVMKFFIASPQLKHRDPSQVPRQLLPSPPPPIPTHRAVATRYIAMYEYESATGEPTHLYINGQPFDAPATETPRSGTSEVWHVINLTEDNHPLHIHLGLFVVLEQRELVELEKFKGCMMRKNDAEECNLKEHAKGRFEPVPAHERGWKNVFKMQPGFVTQILVRFAMLRSEEPYPFDATAEPGYVYHCHILDHEDNMMMRPLKLLG